MNAAGIFLDPTMHRERVRLCESIITHEYTNKLLCLEALQASGHYILWDNQLLKIDKNDKLAVLGDTVAKSVLCQAWYRTGRAKDNPAIDIVNDQADRDTYPR